jgi:hypothetical protein
MRGLCAAVDQRNAKCGATACHRQRGQRLLHLDTTARQRLAHQRLAQSERAIVRGQEIAAPVPVSADGSSEQSHYLRLR